MQALCVYLNTEILAYQHVKTFLLKQESLFFEFKNPTKNWVVSHYEHGLSRYFIVSSMRHVNM